MCNVEWIDVINVLKFFSSINVFTYVDRIGNALSPDVVEDALYDALRHLRSLYYSSFEVFDENSKRSIRYIRVGDTGKIVPLPRIPSSNEISSFLKAVRDDITCAKVTAIYALSF